VTHFDLPGLKAEQSELEERMGAPGFWDDVETANKVNQRLKTLQGKIQRYEKLVSASEDLEVLMEMIEESDDESMLPELEEEYKTFAASVEELRLSTLLKGEYDGCNAILSLHAGAGGTEAQDWV